MCCKEYLLLGTVFDLQVRQGKAWVSNLSSCVAGEAAQVVQDLQD